jgi:phosphoglucomutase
VISPLAGIAAPAALLINVGDLVRAYYERQPDMDDPSQRVVFGTSGHRGSAFDGAFNEAHILAITQAICEHRKGAGVNGSLFIGKDTHALSGPAQRTALEVLAANGVTVVLQSNDEPTPTPAISHAILAANSGRATGSADGIVVTPSHNPPADGGFKYNPPNGGPADTDVTNWIQDRANTLLRAGNAGVKRIAYEHALAASTTVPMDLMQPYVDDLGTIIDFEVIRAAGLKLGVDPLGSASTRYWDAINARYGVEIDVVNHAIDPTFSFMTVDRDGKIRMDPSSAYAMARLVDLAPRFDVAFALDTDSDRHGIVTPSGLMNPNAFLAVAIQYLHQYRKGWRADAMIGKTVVSSSIIDRVATSIDRLLLEVPVGFKWFVEGLLDGTCCFGGEESAGASFLRRDGTVWTTDKDGLIMGLLAAEITAQTLKDPSVLYGELTAALGTPISTRIDAPATLEQKASLSRLAPDAVRTAELAGEPIVAKLTRAPGNGAPIGGLKVVTKNGWFAARPSGTENIYKIYAETFLDEAHLDAIVDEAQRIVTEAVSAPSPSR